MLIGERLIVKRFDRWLDHSVNIIVSHWDERLEAWVDTSVASRDFLFRLSADVWTLKKVYAIGNLMGIVVPR